MYMDGEARVDRVGQRLMSLIEERHSAGQIVPRASHQATDLESGICELLTLLDRSSTRHSLSLAQAVVLVADTGQTLLHLSASLGFEHLLKLLLEQGVGSDLRDASGFTALHFAALYGHINCIRLLVHQGADLIATDRLGRTAKQVACQAAHYNVVEFLEVPKPAGDECTPAAQDLAVDSDHGSVPGMPKAYPSSQKPQRNPLKFLSDVLTSWVCQPTSSQLGQISEFTRSLCVIHSMSSNIPKI